jgi:hypothetical protein
MDTDIFAEPLVFTNATGEELSLTEIAKRTIVSITIAYLSKPRKVRENGWKGILGLKKTVQEDKEVTISDDEGIILYFTDGHGSATIRFSKRSEWHKITDYDEDTLIKGYIFNLFPYRINFHAGNIKKINWAEIKA